MREEHEILFREHEGNRAVRHGNRKLVGKNGQPWELYNIIEDRPEMFNLADDSTEMVENLARLYFKWAKEVNVITKR